MNVGLPREVIWNSRLVTTGIFKESVSGLVRVRKLGLEGDKQVDLTVHGGVEKAVYAYPSEHYEHWKVALGDRSLPWGMFGENLTTEGLLEQEVRLGDEFRINSATVMVTQPRFPCYKLGIKFGTMQMVRRFQKSGRSGFYLAVLEEGEVEAGDRIDLLHRNTSNPTVSEAFSSVTTEA